ncbi:glycosyltransferase [Streptomyces sp. NPDC058220]|uniref:glycosyltransferase n=1 Tax=Streptomyces sp. NPDC058220 TaxID=3346387 RepID=UPI0036E89708
MKPEALAVVVPSHNDAPLLTRALASLRTARHHPDVAGLRVITVVVADACTDHTESVARRAGVDVIRIAARNPGLARAAGAAHALSLLGVPAESVWIATTDADGTVPAHWLAYQKAQARRGWDAVIGTVTVDSWPAEGGPGLAARFHALYRATRPIDGRRWRHPHVHGANLGVAAHAYVRVGGFPPLATGEDHALVAALERHGHRILRTDACPVTTSARLAARARGGFGDHLRDLAGDSTTT